MEDAKKDAAVIILGAGLGTRMKSNKAKVLHEILHRPMVLYVVETAKKIAGNNVILVIGHQAESVRRVVSETADVIFALPLQVMRCCVHFRTFQVMSAK